MTTILIILAIVAAVQLLIDRSFVDVPKSERPPILNKRHDDWVWPLKYLPRSINAFYGYAPRSGLIVGNWKSPKPIPDRGYWVLRIWPWPYFAFQTKTGKHGRALFRWDDVDRYYDLSVAYHDYGK